MKACIDPIVTQVWVMSLLFWHFINTMNIWWLPDLLLLAILLPSRRWRLVSAQLWKQDLVIVFRELSLLFLHFINATSHKISFYLLKSAMACAWSPSLASIDSPDNPKLHLCYASSRNFGRQLLINNSSFLWYCESD